MSALAECYSETYDSAKKSYYEVNYSEIFANFLAKEPGIRGDVLDVGCGPAFHPLAHPVLTSLPKGVDGLDPSDDVLQHPNLRQRWKGGLEALATEIAATRQYDVAYTNYVVEHIPEARAFFEGIRKVLKPGGVFWALTPNAGHPFCKISRFVEVMGGKYIYGRHHDGINDYPAYYRLNSAKQVLKAVEGLGFRLTQFHYLPAGWSGYFPRGFKWVSKAIDWTFCNRFYRRHLILLYRLELEPSAKPG